LKNESDMDVLLSLIKKKGMSLRVSNYFHKKFEKHLEMLKHVNCQPLLKQNWIKAAFQEKLRKFESNPEDLTEKKIHFKLEEELVNEINAKVDKIKKFRNFSKTQWMIEAIYEKLDREAKVILEKFEEKINS